MINVFIYAQGKGSRWIEGSHFPVPSEYKQLIPIGDEPLIHRTARQFGWLGVNNIIVFGKHSVFGGKLPEVYVDIHELNEPTGSIIDGLCSTYMFWGMEGKSILILGDVIFDNYVVKQMMDYSGDQVSVFGRMSGNRFTGKMAREIFGLVIPEDEKKGFHYILTRAINHFSVERSYKKLWDLCHYIINYSPLDAYVFQDYTESSYTDDIDSPEDWRSYGEKLVNLALEDDKNFVLA